MRRKLDQQISTSESGPQSHEHVGNTSGQATDEFAPKLDGQAADAEQCKDNEADVRQWASQCIYTCQICNFTMTQSKSLAPHVNFRHRILKNNYVKKYGERPSKEVMHTCKICGIMIQWEYDKMKKHVEKVCKMSLKDYHMKYFAKKDELPDSQTDDRSGNINGQAVDEFVPKPSALVAEAMGPKEDAPDLHTWASKCTFTCHICDFTTTKRFTFKTHVERNHSMRFEVYKENFGSGITDEVYHTCVLCGHSVLWDLSSMKLHIQKACKRNLADYYHMLFPHAKVAKSSTSVDLSQCTFICQICDHYETKNENTFMAHVKRTHRITQSEYHRKFQTGPSTVVKHDCMICGVSITWNHASMKDHIQKRHFMKLENYYLKFMIGQKKQTDDKTDDEGDNELLTKRLLMEEKAKKKQENKKAKAEVKASNEPKKKRTMGSFACAICTDFKTKNFNQFKRHATSAHGMDLISYQSKYGDPYEKKEESP